MLRSLDTLGEGFEATVKKSAEECGDNLEKIRQFVFVMRNFFETVLKCCVREGVALPKYNTSLVFTSLLELFRISGHILFLSCNGLYRNAFDDIRYALELIVQALYIDIRHPETSLGVKIEILKEVEDKREYHAVRLIDELKIGHKDRLKGEYKKLSRIIHPSHKQIIATIVDVKKGDMFPATVDCEMISKIYDSIRVMYDIFLFLFLQYFPEVKETLQKNSDFNKDVKVYKLSLLSRMLNVRLDKSSN